MPRIVEVLLRLIASPALEFITLLSSQVSPIRLCNECSICDVLVVHE
jgi:hypothetical protein